MANQTLYYHINPDDYKKYIEEAYQSFNTALYNELKTNPDMKDCSIYTRMTTKQNEDLISNYVKKNFVSKYHTMDIPASEGTSLYMTILDNEIIITTPMKAGEKGFEELKDRIIDIINSTLKDNDIKASEYEHIGLHPDVLFGFKYLTDDEKLRFDINISIPTDIDTNDNEMINEIFGYEKEFPRSYSNTIEIKTLIQLFNCNAPE